MLSELVMLSYFLFQLSLSVMLLGLVVTCVLSASPGEQMLLTLL